MNVDVIDEKCKSFIMGQIVAMETSVTSTVSLRMFGYWTGIFVCGLHICVQNLSKIGQELAILQNWPWPKKIRPPALGKVIEPRSHVTFLFDSESNWKHFGASWKSLWWLVQKLCPHLKNITFYFLWPWPWSDFYQIYGMPSVQPDETNVKKRA